MSEQYVIWNTTEQSYVARLGSEHSFTKYLQKARIFTSLDAAKRDCCGNEVPKRIHDAMRE